MSKINIITIHKEPNYGAVLQAFALYHIIERLGYTPNIVNLSIEYRRLKPTVLNRVLLWGYKRIKGYNIPYKIASDFQDKWCSNHTKTFRSVDELKKNDWSLKDKYIIGSDQVWNPEITGLLSDAFTLSFLSKDHKKYSYASSFGNIKDEKSRAQQLDLESIRTFRKVSVRETFGVDFLAKQNIEAIEVIDPTLLLDRYDFLLPRAINPSGELLFLSLSDTKLMNEFVNDISIQANLPVDKRYGYLQPSRDLNKRFLPIEEWLQKIAESSLVVTDSFHAMVFAIQFHKDFIVYISEPSKIHRINNILNILGIKGRVLSGSNCYKDIQPIDYNKVDKILSEYRSKSLSYLNNILEDL